MATVSVATVSVGTVSRAVVAVTVAKHDVPGQEPGVCRHGVWRGDI